MANEDLSRLKIDRSATGSGVPGKRPRLAGVLTIVLLLIVGVILYFRASTAFEVETSSVATAYPSQAFTLLNATGYVVAQRKAAVASKATGRVEWLGVSEGSKVTENEIIARLENADVTATMEQAAANIKVAKANLQQAQAELLDAQAAFSRNKELLTRGFISPFAYDAVTARYHKAEAAVQGYRAAVGVAEANYRAAEIAVEQTLIRAPFDGVVLTKSANIGDVITPFSSALDAKGAVVSMADMNTLEVEADVSETNLPKVKVGQPCEILLDALPNLRLRGVVQSIVPTVDRAKATVVVKVRFIDRDPQILPEMSAKVAFLEREMSADQRTARTVVPLDAIVQRNGKSVVFTMANGQATKIPVETGQTIGDVVEVLKGPAPGDKVIVRPDDGLDHGDKVKTATK